VASLTRGRICLLYMLLAHAIVVFVGSESLGIRDHILQSQISDFPFRRLLLFSGSRWRYSTPPPHRAQSALPLRRSFANLVENTLLNSSVFHICGNSLFRMLLSWICLKGSIRTQSNGVFCVTTRTCLAKLHPVDEHVPALKMHVTIDFALFWPNL
jgi:hypothetical protein